MREMSPELFCKMWKLPYRSYVLYINTLVWSCFGQCDWVAVSEEEYNNISVGEANV